MNLLRLKVVLAAIDRDDTSRIVLEAARTLADAGGTKLHVVHVETPRNITSTSPQEIDGATIDAVLGLLGQADVHVDRAQVHLVAGDPAHMIRTLADRVRADVIVLGPHRERRRTGPGIGSTALAIATASWAPCLIVTDGIRLPLARVLVPVDLSDTARGALMVGLSWSSALRGGAGAPRPEATPPTQLTALYVFRAGGPSHSQDEAARALDAEIDRVRREAGSWAGVTIDGATTSNDDVAAAIADRAMNDRSDLVVLGTRGLGVDAVGRLGSVSQAVSRRVSTPVLLVPPAVWEEFREQ